MDAEAEEDLGRFVALARPGLLRHAQRLVHDHALAEDLVQAALERTVEAWDGIRAVEASGAYCRRVMLTTWVTWRRRRWNGELPSAELPERPDADETSRVEDALVLSAALDRLPPRTRQVLVLRYVEDLPEAEVAARLGRSVTGVRSTAARGLARLRLDPSVAALRPSGGADGRMPFDRPA